MASIGRPQMKNPFAQIAMRKDPGKSAGEILNKISGNKGTTESGIKIVDGKKHNQLGKNDFLKLLTQQLSNQDPMKPVDQKKFAADLAQFSSLEQLANMNNKLDGLKVNSAAEKKFYGASFLGKQVMTKGTTINYEGDGVAVDLPFYLPKDAKALMVRVYDEKGQMIMQLEKQGVSKGTQNIAWDGKQLDGLDAGKGVYKIDVRGWDESFNEFKGQTKSAGVVTGVNFEDGKTVLVVDGKKRIFLHDVESFKVLEHNSIKKESNLHMQKTKAQNAYGQASEGM